MSDTMVRMPNRANVAGWPHLHKSVDPYLPTCSGSVEGLRKKNLHPLNLFWKTSAESAWGFSMGDHLYLYTIKTERPQGTF